MRFTSRSRSRLTIVVSLAALAATPATSALAQDAAQHDEQPPRLTYGTTVGALTRADGYGEEALDALLQLQPREWLVIGATPGFARVTDSSGVSARSGLTDLPLSVGVQHEFARADLHPSVGLAGVVALPTGNAQEGLGAGHAALSAEASVGVAPRDGLDLRLGAWHGFSSAAGSGVGQGGSSLSGEASYQLAERLEGNVLFDAELGARGDSTYAPARVLGGGAAFSISGPLTLTLQGTHAVAGDGPRWALSVGIGTAFAGISPIGATSPLSRIRGAFAHGTRRGGGGSTLGSACRKRGTC